MKLLHIIIQLVWVAITIMNVRSFSGILAFLATYYAVAFALGFLFQKFNQHIDWDEVVTVVTFSGGAMILYLVWGDQLKLFLQNTTNISWWRQLGVSAFEAAVDILQLGIWVFWIAAYILAMYLMREFDKYIRSIFSWRYEDKPPMGKAKLVEMQEKALWDGLEAKDRN